MFQSRAILLALGLATACRTLTPDPKELGFGETYVGDTSTAQEVFWHDGFDAMRVDGVAITTVSPFRITAPIPYRVPDRLTTRTPTISIVFTPSSPGFFRAEAAPQSIHGPLDSTAVELTGTGVLQVEIGGGYLKAGPDPVGPHRASLDFGDVVVGKGAYRTLTLTNRNDQRRSLRIEFGKAGTPFSAAATETSALTELDLDANETRTIVLEFTPKAPGAAADQVTIKDKRILEPARLIDLNGRGLSPGG